MGFMFGDNLQIGFSTINLLSNDFLVSVNIKTTLVENIRKYKLDYQLI